MSKKTVQKNDPWAPAQPYILNSLAQTQKTFDANQPTLQKYAGMQQDAYGRLAPGAETGITGAQGLVNDTLGGKYLQGNPYLTGMIDETNRGITNDVNGQFESSGRYGSGAHTGVLTDRLAAADNNLRYQNYAAERQNQIGAVGQAQGLMGGATSLLNNAADLPWVGTAALSGGIRQSSNGYGVTTSTTNDPLGQITGLVGAAGSLVSAYKSDARAKDINRQVGTTPDGLPIFDFTYKGDPTQTPQVGPMAQDVAQLRPDALGPTGPDGMMSVDHGKLGLPDPTTTAKMTGAAPPDAQVPAAARLTDVTANSLTPQLPKVVDRSFGAILDRFASPDANDKWGRIGLLSQRLMAGEGSPFQALGEGLIGSRKDARVEAADKAKTNLETIKALAAYRKAQAGTDTRTASQKDLEAAGLKPGTPEYNQALLGIAQARVLPTGFVMGPQGAQPMPGFMTPVDKEAYTSKREDARQAASDARQAAMFAHSDAMQARSLAAMSSRQAAAGGTQDMEPATIDYVANQYRVTGQLPPLGMGRSAASMRQAIIARAAQLDGGSGVTGQQAAANHATYKAGVKSLGMQTEQADLTTAGETTAKADLDRWVAAAGNAPGQDHTRPVNALIQGYARLTNDPAMAAADTAREDAARKVTRVISGMLGSGAATDSANKIVSSIFDSTDSPKTKAARIQQLIAGMGNQTAGQRAQIAATTARLGGGAQSPAQAAVNAKLRPKAAPRVVNFADLP